jgi:glycosyltransferase involved in cell wall biosynthesis
MITTAIIHNHPIHYKHLLFQELKRQGLQFEVLFTASRSSDRIEPLKLHDDLYRFRAGFDGPYERHPPLRTWAFVWLSLEQIDPAVVIISGWYDLAAWAAWCWAEAHRRPKILWGESNRFDRLRPFYRELPKRLFVRWCSAANVYGTANKDYLVWLGMPPQKIFTKRAVADVSLFLNCNGRQIERPPYKVLLYVGRFSPQKNLEFLIRAFARARHDYSSPRMALALVGYGPLESRLRALAERLGARDTVQFWGPALQAELPSIYRKADAFILPSVRETWGLVVLEAMLSGLPVLVSERCGCAHDLVAPETGWTFNPYDEPALGRLLEHVCAAPREALEQMGEAGTAVAREYSPENCARIVIQTVGQVLEETRTQRRTRR